MADFLPFSKEAEIFRWGPIPGRYFYVSEFDDAIFQECPGLYKGMRWPNTLFLFKDKKMVWINDFAELRNEGKLFFSKYILPEKARAKLKNQWLKAVKKLSAFEAKLDEQFFSDLSDSQLYSLWEDFYKIIIDFWVPTVPAELGNYGSAPLLEEKLKKYISDLSEFASAMEILTAPEGLSFYQQEEIDLAKAKDIKKHGQKYFWLRNSYNGAEALDNEFFAQRKKEVDPKIKMLVQERIEGAKKKKKKLISKYKLPREIKNISNALCEAALWQDERKKHIFIYTHYKEMFLEEVARRYKYEIDGLRNCSSKEVMEVLKKKGLHSKIDQRSSISGFYVDPYQKELTFQEAAFCWDAYAQENLLEKSNELSGIVASKGLDRITKGAVKIIFDPKENKGFKEGDILVAPMTSPEFIFLMKKAKAIITDSGGLTSHAAIVSRELNIPCIVGTKTATKLLNDGNMVEIDTFRGIVKII